MLANFTAKTLRHHFFGWQCRLRQMSVRNAGGRPTSGMRPDVVLAGGEQVARITVLIVKAEPMEATDRFRHFYRRPNEFADEMSALFGPGAAVATILRHLEKARRDLVGAVQD